MKRYFSLHGQTMCIGVEVGPKRNEPQKSVVVWAPDHCKYFVGMSLNKLKAYAVQNNLTLKEVKE